MTNQRLKNYVGPGLKAKDHLSRVITRAVKEAEERRENEAWAQNQIARVLNYVPTGYSDESCSTSKARRTEENL